MKMLDAATLPLHGRHLIEASAGTGKTYNITRLYLRLLIEKQLTVQQILVMTFTKAATEELRGRIDEELRIAVAQWGSLGANDPFFAEMEQKYSREQALQILKPALLELDEAAIFTIHSFCRRALLQQAFSSGIPLEVSMESDTSELLMESVRDWMRCINHDKQRFELLANEGWHTPEAFYDKFRKPLCSNSEVIAPQQERMEKAYQGEIGSYCNALFSEEKARVLEALQRDQETIFELLVNSDAKKKVEREKEWDALIGWLQCDDETPCPKEAGAFIDGRRYSKKGLKEVLTPIFEPFKNLRKTFSDKLKKYQALFERQLGKLPAYQLAVEGIAKIRERFIAAKKQQAVMDFDDLITLLSEQIESETSQPLIDALRQQFPVALVDEFQDTDPHQYAIFDALYPKGDKQHLLLMIGDPKQAIYAFRGGDIFTYLQARDGADYQWVMDTNWRSVADVVTGYNRLFWGQPLHQETPVELFGCGIGYEKIKHTENAKANKRPLSDPEKGRGALNYLWLDSSALTSDGAKGSSASAADDQSEQAKGKVKVTNNKLKEALAQHCVAEIARLLGQAQLGDDPVKEQDIAILVRRGKEAELIQRALADAGYPSVYLSAKEDVYTSVEAIELLRLLEGLLEWQNDSLLITALSTSLMGGNADRLATFRNPKHELEWEDQKLRMAQLRQLWLERGCMALLMHIIHNDYQPAPERHERALTNMLHLAELLQLASRRHKHPQQLVKWFKEQCRQQSANEESQLRLESDADLIRVVTMHGSKGLEYPIVFIPFASNYMDPVRFGKQLYDYYEYHDSETHQPVRLVGQTNEAIAQATAEGEAESIRLLYVAVTRAAHRCYLGVAPFIDSERSALGLALKVDNNEDWLDKLQSLTDSSNGSSKLLHLTASRSWEEGYRASAAATQEILPAAEFTAKIDDNWALSSFSGLVRNAAHMRQEIKERSDNDEESLLIPVPAVVDAIRFTLRKGADAGNLLHDILEHTDFSNPQWQWAMEAPVQRFGRLDTDQQEALQMWLADVLQAKLPPLFSAEQPFSMAELTWPQTLREAEFYFPITQMKLSDLSDCLQQYRDTEMPINLPRQDELAGMMHGFIDLIFEHRGRFYVADYKSTHLGNALSDYHPDALKMNNQAHFYDLQYLIYCVALHRFLKVRLADYDPDKHLGGVYYLYLRGMSSQPPVDNPYAGVFSTTIPVSFLLTLDKIFAGRSRNREEAKGGAH